MTSNVFGANSLIHTSKVLRLSEDLPVAVEIIDDVEMWIR
jgi:hypothetical protein